MLFAKGEVRHIVLIVILLALLMLMCLSSELYLHASSEELVQTLEQVQSKDDLALFEEKYNQITDIWMIMISHDEITALSNAYFHLCGSTELTFQGEKEVLLQMIKDIPVHLRMSVQNIL